jgi:hypothetical protein
MKSHELPRRWMSPGSHDLWGSDRTHYKALPTLLRPTSAKGEGLTGDFDDVIKLGDVAMCVENTLWFSLYEKTKAPLTPEQQQYVDAVKKAVSNL